MNARTILILFLACCAQALCGRDAFVMLSGGDSPLENNYSQYLQAKAVLGFFERNYPPDSIWVFFGAGNQEGEKPVFGDVRRQSEREGVVVDSWLPGSLHRNRPARRDVILRALREEILPTVANGGTLYLFVGDHGTRTRGRNRESIIALWSLERDRRSEHGWRADEDQTLGVTELRRTLAGGLGKGRVVFCMTQCHAGGFHYLAMPREMTPNPKWFTQVPDWTAPRESQVWPRAAGFTATDELSSAAGCDPDPDPEEWAGYERFVPEKLLGVDLMTLKQTSKGLQSFAEAHVAATLVDGTIDKPYSTSEQYLERWASLIETRLAKESNLTARVKTQLAAYQRAVDGAAIKVGDRAFRERQATFQHFVETLAERNPATKTLLLSGTRKELEDAIGTARRRGRGRQPADQVPSRRDPAERGSPPPSDETGTRGSGRRRGGSQLADARKLWIETIGPAWKGAIEANQVPGVPVAALEFEKSLLRKDVKGADYLFSGVDALDGEVFWNSGYSEPQTLDVEKAEAIARWGAERSTKIFAWAKTAPDATVRAAAEKLAGMKIRGWENPAAPQPPAAAAAPAGSKPPMSKKVAAERALFYRRVLGAWEFLLALNERPALARVRELTELERTPLPPRKKL